ncbi:MAG: hypothetical protein MZV65_31665 [Chromatiales bacterium]|nr:hypothetical protein [Chromatiales bacterium]
MPISPELLIDDAHTFAALGGAPDTGVLDWHGLAPGVEHWYADYYWVDGVWQRSEPRAVTLTVQVHPPSLDSLDVIRERVEIGLNALVQAGILHHPRGAFGVLTAPPVLDDIVFPAVAVHLEQATPDQYSTGGFIGSDWLETGCRRDTEGWRLRYSVLVQS